jgi:hypothetical protein
MTAAGRGVMRPVRTMHMAEGDEGMTVMNSSTRSDQSAVGSSNVTGERALRRFGALSKEQARAALQIRPDPVAAIRRSGSDPYRILLFGGGLLRGVGLRDHELGLPGRIADRLHARRGRGVRLDVVVEAHPTSPSALAGLAGMRLRRYDAIVLVLGEQESAHAAPAQWRGELVGLTKLLLTETCPSAGLFVYDSTRAVVPTSAVQLNPRAAASAERLVLVSEEVCGIAQRVRFAEFPPSVLPADPVSGFVDGTYEDWAAWLVDRLEPALAAVDRSTDEDTPRRYRARVQDERFRQRAVDSLHLHLGDRDEHLDREVLQAKLMYRADHAVLNIVDRDAVWTRATAAPDVQALERAQAFCSIGVRSDDLLLINDTWADPRTQGNPLTQGPRGVRFYAGFPVRTWDGYRVGMVCIAGRTPRSFRPRELEGLRDIAARVEQSLWRLALQPAHR